jgi:hypothetical protein
MLERIDFLGEVFNVPADPRGVVRNLYGRSWTIPIAGRPARVSNILRLKKVIAHPEKGLFYLRRFISLRLKWAGFARRARRQSRGQQAK